VARLDRGCWRVDKFGQSFRFLRRLGHTLCLEKRKSKGKQNRPSQHSSSPAGVVTEANNRNVIAGTGCLRNRRSPQNALQNN